jgi:transposase
MKNGSYWVGLDIGDYRTSICVLDAEDSPVLERAVETSGTSIAEGLHAFRTSEIEVVAVESGADSGLLQQLRQLQLPLVVLDAGKVSRFLAIRSNKTDRNDARGLAEIARLGGFAHLRVHIRGADCQLIRDQLVIRQQLVRQRVAIRNALRSMLRRNGSALRQVPTGATYRESMDAELEALAAAGNGSAADQIRPLVDICEALTSYIARSDKSIRQQAEEHPIARRFMAIPGVGPVCALSFYSAIEDPMRFPHTAAVGAYLGMVPRTKQSGVVVQRSKITRAGNKMTRAHLVMSAGVMLSRAAKDTQIGDWGKSLVSRIGYAKARIAVARKMAVAMLSIWKSDADFVPYPTGP